MLSQILWVKFFFFLFYSKSHKAAKNILTGLYSFGWLIGEESTFFFIHIANRIYLLFAR